MAAFIADVLAEDGSRVDALPFDRVTELTRYDRIVVGSAIRYDRWLPEAMEFVETHQQYLGRIPSAFFFTCLVLAKRTVEAEQKAGTYADQLARRFPAVKPVDIKGFAGVLDISRAPWLTRWVLRGLSAVSGVAEGDYRDWQAIRSWARNLFPISINEKPPVTAAPLGLCSSEPVLGRNAGFVRSSG